VGGGEVKGKGGSGEVKMMLECSPKATTNRHAASHYHNSLVLGVVVDMMPRPNACFWSHQRQRVDSFLIISPFNEQI